MKTERQRQVRKMRIILGFGSFIVLYLLISIPFRERFYFFSYINGVNYGGKTVRQVETQIAEDISKYKLTIKERNKEKEIITAADIGLTYVSDGKIQELKDAQPAFNWWIGSLRKDAQQMEATTTYNRKKLTAVLNGLNCLDKEKVVQPENAQIVYKDGEYVIEEAVKGNALDETKFRKLVKKAVESGITELDLEEEKCYKLPEYDADKKELVAAKKKMNQYIKTEITYDFSDRTEVLNGDVIKDWLSLDDDFQVVIDEQAEIDYIKSLEAVYNTLGKSREFTTHDKRVITVPSGNYGYMISRWNEKDQMDQDIKAGKTVKREPVYAFRGYIRDENDIGDTYVEIDLKKQKMWFYKNGKVLVKTNIVTGNVSTNHATPIGVYGITYKERDATLVGENYRSPVKYWMPFNENIGIHDAGWRTKFGKEIYKTNGSHGCVNTPEKNAAKIFKNIEKGMPVIVHN